MTTSQTPVAQLRAQANAIAQMMKKIDSDIEHNKNPKIAAAKARGTFKPGIVMDDKVITIEIPWDKVRDITEHALTEYILKLMQGTRGQNEH